MMLIQFRDATEPSQGVFTFQQADVVQQFAAANSTHVPRLPPFLTESSA